MIILRYFFLFLSIKTYVRGIACRNFMKIKPANRISDISTEAQHFLQDCICTQRLSKES